MSPERTGPVRVVVVDDQPTIRMGLRMILDHEADVLTVGEAADGEEAVAVVRELHPDVVLLDVRMPRCDGVEATARLRADPGLADVRIVVLTTFDDEEYLVGALRAGADAFLLKDSDPATLIWCVHAVCRGESVLDPKVTARLVGRWRRLDEAHPEAARSAPPPPTGVSRLSGREREVLVAVAGGGSNREIAAAMGLTESTVKSHVHTLLSRLGCTSRAQLVARAYELGLVRPQG